MKFRNEICAYYRAHGRHILPWRKTRNPYKILVSEVMLQQTQVSRVIPKYKEFLREFPTVRKFAATPLPKVLKIWQGLGYNRRALMLHRAAKIIVSKFGGTVPPSVSQLVSLPGVGPATAAGIMNFAFGVATPYLETNVRSVYLHYFFHDKKGVTDKQILSVIEKTMDRKNPREWFCALLDYGVMLKKVHGNPNQRSAHYAKQSPFEGSNRQRRARLLRNALSTGASERELLRLLGSPR